MQIEETLFDGLNAIAIRTPKAEMVIVTEIGPRIAYFGRPAFAKTSRNLLFWDSPKEYFRGEWILRGGHRVWNTRPMADEAEETYGADNKVCKVQVKKNGVSITAPVHDTEVIQKSLHIKVLNDDTFEVENRIHNPSSMLWSGGCWGLTCTLPGKKTSYGVPVGDGSEWDMFNIVVAKRWANGQTSRVNDPQVSFTENCCLIKPMGVQCKRMIQGHQGIIGMTDLDQNLSFIKKVNYQQGANYPLGCNIAFYIGPKNFMVEMETMTPDVCLKPKEDIKNVETWMLRDPVIWKDLKGPMKL